MSERTRGGSKADARLPSLKGVAVLIVDDDPSSAKLVSVILAAEGCEIHVATSAEEALRLLETHTPRVVIIDVVLPMMSGLLLAQSLKARPQTSEIPLIAMSAVNGPTGERLAREAGFVAYVVKPIEVLAFAELVQRHLRGRP